MDTKQKAMKGKDKTANELKVDNNKNMLNKKTADVKPDDKKNDMKKDGDKKNLSSNNK